MGRSQEDQTLQVADVLGVVGKVGIELEVEVDVQVQGTQNGEPKCISLLVDHQQSRAILLPLFLVDVNEHFGSGNEENRPSILVEPELQLFLQQRVDLHLTV